MFDTKRITDIEYYESRRQEGVDEGVDALAYYTGRKDNGANPDEATGVWWSSTSVSPNNGDKPFVAHGQNVDAKALRQMAEGKHPETGQWLIRNNQKKRTVGYDNVCSAPKSVSGVWAMEFAHGNYEAAEAVKAAHHKANAKALEVAWNMGLVITRTGAAGSVSQQAAEVVAAQYTHHTSRDGDPQIHTHNVMLNICRREDGTTGTIDNREMMKYKRAIGALYRGELANEMKKLGYGIEGDETAFRIAGFPEQLEDLWSKRRESILEALEEYGVKDTANHREAAQAANFATRKAKTEQPPLSVLTGRWKAEMQSLGLSLASVREEIGEACAKAEREADAKWEEKRAEAKAAGVELPAERPAYDLEEIKAEALAALTQHNSVFDNRIIMQEVFERLQTHVGADEALAILDTIKDSGELVQVGVSAGEAVYSTPELVKREKTMLKQALDMKGSLAPISSAIVESVIASGQPINEQGDRAELRDEQAAAVRHLLSGDQLAIMEGRAGAGKSFTLGAVKDAAEQAGYFCHALAPSWKATKVLQDDTQIAEEYSRAITGWLRSVERGDIEVDAETLLIVDEAGMVGLDHMSSLVSLAKERGARIVLAGDTRQLQPVAAGAPMAAIAQMNGVAVLGEIVRQKVGWQRKASVAFAQGRVSEAMAEYSKWGHIRYGEDAKTTQAALVDHYMRSVSADGERTRLILASTNGDAKVLNNAIRARRVELGELKGEEVSVPCITRGKFGRRTEIGFMPGDRIVLGETLTIGGGRYSNNSTGTVLAIKKGEGGEVRWKIRWDDGRILDVENSELIGYRNGKESLEDAVKISHAYAMTVHSSQGMTVDEVCIYNANGMGREATYVAMTRHRHDVMMFVDESRISDDLAALNGTRLLIERSSGATHETDPESEATFTREQIEEKLVAECAKSEAKKNICDFQESVEEWLGTEFVKEDEPKMERDTEGGSVGQGTGMRPRGGLAANPFVRGLGRIGGDVDPAKTRENMEQRATSGGLAAVPRPKKPLPGASNRLSKDEIHTLVSQNLAEYMIADGAQLRATSKGGDEWTLSFGKGKGCVVKRWPEGNHTFFMRDRSASGDIRNYVQWRDGSTFGQASHKLRAEFGTKHSAIAAPALVRDPRPQETVRERFDRLLSEAYVGERFAQIRGWWKQGREAVSSYLSSRGISRETQAAFRGGFRCEGADTYDGNNKQGVMFAMRDGEGNLTGFLRKGPKAHPAAKRDFSMNAEGTERHMIVMGDPTTARRVYIGETPIDGMTLAQKDGATQGAAIMATAGSAAERGLALVYKVARSNPAAEWHYVAQNDAADAVNEKKVKEAIREGNSEARIETRRPPVRFKDWNDEMQGRMRSAPTAEEIRHRTAEQMAAREAYETAKEQMADARRQAEGEVKPKGPELG